MDSMEQALLVALIVALVGWLATMERLLSTMWGRDRRRRLVVPVWFVWMVLALGGVVGGRASLTTAFQAAGGIAAGLSVMILVRQLHRRGS